MKKLLTQIYYTKLATIAVIAVTLFLFPKQIFAANNQPHYTMIINQVRGPECCDPGNTDFLRLQLQTLRKENLKATFAVRFDALEDDKYIQILTDAKNNGFEMAAFLEITPSLASQSGVIYHDDIQNWYRPGNLYLSGYTQEDRKKLIDTYMSRFEKIFKTTPTTTVSWIIDAYSLEYLSNRYHVKTHEITRDQWNTDRLTLYGGPTHYPYIPSQNWPLVPQKTITANSPIIIRQTISDPVENYGDPTDSHTSQPNDFMRRTTDFSYFEFLFNQAHDQKLNDYTIAVLGLENSMEEKYQQMFVRQLEYVAGWKNKDINNLVVPANEFVLNRQQPFFTVYEGSIQNNPASRAWWINSASYRLRLRLDNGRLFISDLRVYDDKITDPYFYNRISSGAYWITPFVIDSSRLPDNLLSPIPDNQKSAGIEIRNDIEKPLEYSLEKEKNSQLTLYDDRHSPVINFGLSWFELPGQNPISKRPVNGNDPLYLPALSDLPVDQSRSFLRINNRYARVNRNPARLIFYPRDTLNSPAAAAISVRANPQVDKISIGQQDDLSGTIMIDLDNSQPLKTEVTVTGDNQSFKQTVFFASNCSKNFIICLKNPKYFWWYLLTLAFK